MVHLKLTLIFALTFLLTAVSHAQSPTITITIISTVQPALGCDEWQSNCPTSQLTYDESETETEPETPSPNWGYALLAGFIGLLAAILLRVVAKRRE